MISHDRRRLEHWNVSHHPTAAWLWQQLIEATAWGRQPRFLIRDRDRCFGGDFVARAAGIGSTLGGASPGQMPLHDALVSRKTDWLWRT